jgi:hypothetical protein
MLSCHNVKLSCCLAKLAAANVPTAAKRFYGPQTARVDCEFTVQELNFKNTDAIVAGAEIY